MKLAVFIFLLKWLSQGLLVIVGIWSLLSNPYETDPTTGRKRLTRSGWMKVALLGIGFVLFTFTELDQRRSSRAASEQQQKTIENQQKSLAYLRQLILQRQLSELRMTVTFPKEVMAIFRESLVQAGKRQGGTNARPDSTKLAYIRTACDVGNAIVRYEGDNRGQLDYNINRPQGLVVDRVRDTDPEWKSFVSAFRSLLGDRFEIDGKAGQVLLDLFNPGRAIGIRFLKNTVTIDIKSPGIRLDDLEGEVSFICGDAKLLFIDHWSDDDHATRETNAMAFGPSTIRFTSKDPTVLWEQQIQLAWTPHSTREIGEVDRTAVLGEWRSGPHRLDARLLGLGGLDSHTGPAQAQQRQVIRQSDGARVRQ